MKRHYYLAYGSNLNVRQMMQRCPQAKPVGAVELEGYDLIFRGVATIEPREGGIVPCGLWLITDTDETALDSYEAWPRLYHKEMVTVTCGRRLLRAMTYIMNEGHAVSPPSDYYLHIIQDGYKDFGLDAAVLDAAVKESELLSVPFELPE